MNPTFALTAGFLGGMLTAWFLGWVWPPLWKLFAEWRGLGILAALAVVEIIVMVTCPSWGAGSAYTALALFVPTFVLFMSEVRSAVWWRDFNQRSSDGAGVIVRAFVTGWVEQPVVKNDNER